MNESDILSAETFDFSEIYFSSSLDEIEIGTLHCAAAQKAHNQVCLIPPDMYSTRIQWKNGKLPILYTNDGYWLRDWTDRRSCLPIDRRGRS